MQAVLWFGVALAASAAVLRWQYNRLVAAINVRLVEALAKRW